MKFVGIAIDIGEYSDGIPFFIQDVKNEKLKVFSSELATEKYLKTNYVKTTILLGTIPDPTPIYTKLSKELKKKTT